MPIPLDSRKKPADIKVRISTGAGVDIVWADHHSSHYDFTYLREQCPCARCDEERRKKEDAVAHPPNVSGTVLGGSGAVLPLFKPRPLARAAKAIGNYALQIDFSDGHTTGIYSYDYLRTICPCEECAKSFRSHMSG
jgi:DUF971 family protein